MTNILFLDDGRRHFEGIAESITMPDCNFFIAKDISAAMDLVREKTFDALFGLLNFAGVYQGGASVALEAFKKDRTTCVILDEQKLIADKVRCDDLSATIRAAFMEIVPRIILMRIKRKEKSVV